ncbi:MAG: thioredoxin [Bacteroidetes bacterium OLB11]|nr:MAG: thioredoxin [Bacteroidetes bacterium OLB11]
MLSCLPYPFFSIGQNFVREIDKTTTKPLLRGKIKMGDLLKESSCSWLEEGTQTYQPNNQYVQQLGENWGNYRFVVFVGTWCNDTKDLLPKFYKTILESQIPLSTIEMYAVDREKRSLKEEEKFYNIDRVPTFIVFHQKREVGRIVESVQESIEADLANIIVKDAQDLEEKKIAKEAQFEKQRQDEINNMKRREKKKYFYTDYYFPNTAQ